MANDLTRRVFGRLTVIESIGYNEHDKQTHWRCRCECGRERSVRAGSLLRGASRSCGCYRNEISSFRHGHARKGKLSKDYRRWMNLVARAKRGTSTVPDVWMGKGGFIRYFLAQTPAHP